MTNVIVCWRGKSIMSRTSASSLRAGRCTGCKPSTDNTRPHFPTKYNIKKTEMQRESCWPWHVFWIVYWIRENITFLPWSWGFHIDTFCLGVKFMADDKNGRGVARLPPPPPPPTSYPHGSDDDILASLPIFFSSLISACTNRRICWGIQRVLKTNVNIHTQRFLIKFCC